MSLYLEANCTPVIFFLFFPNPAPLYLGRYTKIFINGGSFSGKIRERKMIKVASSNNIFPLIGISRVKPCGTYYMIQC